jgi:hypothetical protein
LSVAKSRICTVSSDQAPVLQRPPGDADAQRPRKHLRVEGEHGRAEGHGGGLGGNRMLTQSIGP